MSSTMTNEELAGAYRFESVVPEPLDGPFPPQATKEMGFTLGLNGGMTVRLPVNSGHGASFALAVEDAATTTITFGDFFRTVMGMGVPSVEGDDAIGTLARRMTEAEEFLQQRLSTSAGPYRLTVTRRGDDKRVLVLENKNDGAKLTFVEHDA